MNLPSLRRRTAHAVHGGLYQYHTGAIFTPGADAQVFEPTFSLPIFCVQGNGVQAGNSPRPIQGPQVFAGNPKSIAGIGGLIAGQLLSPGPLLDNENG